MSFSPADPPPGKFKKISAMIVAGFFVLLLVGGIATCVYWMLSSSGNQPITVLDTDDAGATAADATPQPPPPPPPPPTRDMPAAPGDELTNIDSLCFDLAGNLWVAAVDHGVWRFDVRKDVWTDFTAQSGVSDDVTRVACDLRGRVWVGQRQGGIRFYNGDQWKKTDAGAPIFDIAIDPQSGDVWIATGANLLRYSDSHDAWTILPLTDRLPADTIAAIAFDPAGNIFLGAQTAGLVMADSGAEYRNWRTVAGPAAAPTSSTGFGLPANSIHDLLIATDAAVYAATANGLAWSSDHGITWQFVRSPILAEDDCTCLAEDANKHILVGHPTAKIDVLQPRSATVISQLPYPAATAILANNILVIGTRGHGLASAQILLNTPPAPSTQPAAIPFPSDPGHAH